ncbi:translation initiation factor IF-2 N-terminal domain-containing protein, partial [Nocardioides sp.]|uniref:translation initiation factor IF-2 N-terminal domain-containing protein n=1 Tax=Nocardioides sp. TaxID=35761 RepID=UPI0039E26738
MAKTRVSELAKQYGIPSKEALEKLTAIGEYVKTASSSIELPAVKKFEATYGAELKAKMAADQAPAQDKAAAPVPAAQAAPTPKAPVTEAPAPAAAAPPTEPAVKAPAPKPAAPKPAAPAAPAVAAAPAAPAAPKAPAPKAPTPGPRPG